MIILSNLIDKHIEIVNVNHKINFLVQLDKEFDKKRKKFLVDSYLLTVFSYFYFHKQ
jgi:hypothetical protein